MAVDEAPDLARRLQEAATQTAKVIARVQAEKRVQATQEPSAERRGGEPIVQTPRPQR